MEIFTFRSFKQRIRHRRSAFRRFLTKLLTDTPPALDTLAERIEKDVWREVNCLSCANCCKVMSPTYTGEDIKRIAGYSGLSVPEFKKRWLKKETGDWINKSTPCQFLDLQNNKCSIYHIRPVDCAGFPHLPKKKMTDYIHVHKQNVDLCPATYKMVEKLMIHLKDKKR